MKYAFFSAHRENLGARLLLNLLRPPYNGDVCHIRKCSDRPYAKLDLVPVRRKRLYFLILQLTSPGPVVTISQINLE